MKCFSLDGLLEIPFRGIKLEMNPLNVFPYKKMRMLVGLITNGGIGVRQIAAATGMCSFDSTEVADMLAYLSKFGDS